MNVMKRLLTHLYRIENSICLASSPRSGSTWVAETLVRAGKYDFVDEPLRMSTSFKETLLKAGIEARTCLCDADEQRVETVSRLMSEVLRGRVGWLQLYPGASRNLLLKFVRLNRMIAFNVRTFNVKRNILLVRHPCAVISSQLAMHGQNSIWAGVSGPAADIPEKLISTVESLTNGETVRALALNWCLDQRIPIYEDPPENTLLVFYEDLLASPEPEWQKIFGFLGLKNVELKDQPSRTVSADFSKNSQTSKWRNQLSKKEISDILSTCQEMGVELYSDQEMPEKRPW